MTGAELRDYRFRLRLREQGEVLSVGDGIAWIGGLPSAALEQLVTFDDGRGGRGMLFNLSEQHVGAIVLDDSDRIASGMRVGLSEPSLTI
ncbi:MAG TPA: hypothetical protein VMF61_02045, partial [Candidatus Acidoferrales bacterium]|nr:hypothetical protein [Candidatus Acidoferrales bacterium]